MILGAGNTSLFSYLLSDSKLMDSEIEMTSIGLDRAFAYAVIDEAHCFIRVGARLPNFLPESSEHYQAVGSRF